MRFVVGYDQELAGQCFRRNLEQLIRPGENLCHVISVSEVDYFAARLAETAVFSRSDRLGSPWVHEENVKELLRVPPKKANRAQLQNCELLANNILIFEGIVGRTGAYAMMSGAQANTFQARWEAAASLYYKASFGTFRPKSEVEVLQRMAHHVPDWIRYLSFLQGHDFMDLLATMTRES